MCSTHIPVVCSFVSYAWIKRIITLSTRTLFSMFEYTHVCLDQIILIRTPILYIWVRWELFEWQYVVCICVWIVRFRRVRTLRRFEHTSVEHFELSYNGLAICSEFMRFVCLNKTNHTISTRTLFLMFEYTQGCLNQMVLIRTLIWVHSVKYMALRTFRMAICGVYLCLNSKISTSTHIPVVWAQIRWVLGVENNCIFDM